MIIATARAREACFASQQRPAEQWITVDEGWSHNLGGGPRQVPGGTGSVGRVLPPTRRAHSRMLPATRSSACARRSSSGGSVGGKGGIQTGVMSPMASGWAPKSSNSGTCTVEQAHGRAVLCPGAYRGISCRGAEAQRRRGAEAQRRRGAEAQRRRGAILHRDQGGKSSPKYTRRNDCARP